MTRKGKYLWAIETLTAIFITLLAFAQDHFLIRFFLLWFAIRVVISAAVREAKG